MKKTPILELYHGKALDRMGRAYGVSRKRTTDIKLPFGIRVSRYVKDPAYRKHIYEHIDKQKQTSKITRGLPR